MTAVRPGAAALDTVWMRDNGRCALCGGEIHGERGADWSLHHRRPAGMGGDRRPETHAAGNLVLLHGSGSSGCHGSVESRRAEALANGFLVPRLGRVPPTAVVIDHAVHGPTYLHNDGSVSWKPEW